ncbi:MAG: GntR family transcriptional regulator [Acidobacteria bacterium]|nr:GntR family transcriptional regulator [Acidobacteriota bacterium]
MPLSLNFSLDRDSPIPLYFQIAQVIEGEIESGVLKPGEPIPSEFELADVLGVSRPTIRQAIHQLVAKGHVVRRRGIGTVVIHRRIHRPTSTSSFYDALLATGRVPRTQLLELTIDAPSAEIAHALGVAPSTPVVVIKRLRFADDEAIALMTNRIPVTVMEELPTPEELEAESLYTLLRRRGVELDYAHQEISARPASAKEAARLEAPRGSTVLTMARTAFDVNGRAIELGEHIYLADRFSFEMTLPITP